jgi:hypothetical protein
VGRRREDRGVTRDAGTAARERERGRRTAGSTRGLERAMAVMWGGSVERIRRAGCGREGRERKAWRRRDEARKAGWEDVQKAEKEDNALLVASSGCGDEEASATAWRRVDTR